MNHLIVQSVFLNYNHHKKKLQYVDKSKKTGKKSESSDRALKKTSVLHRMKEFFTG